MALARQGKGLEALQVLKRATQLDSAGLRDPRAHEAARASALFHLGRLQLEQGHIEDALAAFLRAKDTMPSNFQPQVRRLLYVFTIIYTQYTNKINEEIINLYTK